MVSRFKPGCGRPLVAPGQHHAAIRIHDDASQDLASLRQCLDELEPKQPSLPGTDRRVAEASRASKLHSTGREIAAQQGRDSRAKQEFAEPVVPVRRQLRPRQQGSFKTNFKKSSTINDTIVPADQRRGGGQLAKTVTAGALPVDSRQHKVEKRVNPRQVSVQPAIQWA